MGAIYLLVTLSMFFKRSLRQMDAREPTPRHISRGRVTDAPCPKSARRFSRLCNPPHASFHTLYGRWRAEAAEGRAWRGSNGSRWNPGKERWRPDRDPRSCTYDQLEETVSFDLAQVLAAPAM